MRTRLFAGVAMMSILAIVLLPLAAQEFRATITGRVLDASGAVIPGVTVQAINVDTNEMNAAVSGQAGNYVVPFLRPGTYNLVVEAAGFKKYTREGVVLQVGQTASIDVVLELGAITQEVTVTGKLPMLETSNANRGNVIDQKQVTELPLNSRNPFMLSMLTAGVNYNGAFIYQRPFDNGAIADWSINGSRNRTNEFLLDGAPNNAQAGGNNIAYVPPVDSVQEFKIQTNSYDAQYGKTGGGIINVSLKSGTNELHGTVYEFARRNSWDANSFQNNAKGKPRSGHKLDQYGFQAGGPVMIPKLWDGRNKSFFMVNYEGYKESTPNPLTLSVAEPEMKHGDFSHLADAQDRAITIYDPTTGQQIGSNWVRNPFPGNMIPQDRLNQVAMNILEYMPEPNTTTAGEAYSRNNFFFAGAENLAKDDFYNFVVKIDQNIGANHRMFFRHASNDRDEMRSTNGIKNAPGVNGAAPLERINDAYVVDWVSTISPTSILNVRASYARYVHRANGLGNEGFDATTLGFPKELIQQLPGGSWFGRYRFDDYIQLGRYKASNITNTVAFHPNVTKTLGSHTIKSGVDMRWIQYSTQNTGNILDFRAQKTFTRKEYNRSDALSGNSIAEFLLGTPTQGSVAYNTFPIFLYSYYAPYIEDDWRVTPRLTVNLGLRWDFNVPPRERYDRLNRGFDSSLINPVDDMVDREAFPDLGALHGGLLFAGVDGVPRRAADLYKSAIQPRIGFAYKLTNKLVMRGGWGRYYLNPDNDYLKTTGFSESTPFVATLDGGRTPGPYNLSDPYPNGINVPPGSALGPLTYVGRSFNWVNPAFKIPHVDQFSFGFEYELPKSSTIEISYVGSRSRDMQVDKGFNVYDLAERQKFNLAEGGDPAYGNEKLPNPFKGIEAFKGTSFYSAGTLSRAQLARPYPHFNGSLTEQMLNDGAMFYNSMQIVYKMRARNVNLVANYTMSKNIERLAYNDVQNSILNSTLADFDIPHRVSVAAVVDLPFGKGHRWLNSSHPFWSRVTGGWGFTVLFQVQSGRPWALPSNVMYVKEAKVDNIQWDQPRVYGVNPCVARWNNDGSITMQSYSVQAGCNDYNFLILPSYAPRVTPKKDGRLRLHSAPMTDFSLTKMTRINERMKVQFRAEAFNLTNTYMFHRQDFNNNPNSATFGSIDKATVPFGRASWPRYVQLAVKFIF